MKILPLLILASSLAACSQHSSNSTAETASTASATSVTPPQIITGDERKKIVSEATKNMHEERDKMERISFYSAKNRDYLKSSLEAYISLPDDRLPILRIKSTYFGEGWVFYDAIKVMADDVVVYERSFDHSAVHRDNSSGSVWETADFYAENADLAALKKIANAKSATIRFSGRERRDDHELTPKEFQQLKEAIAAYENLTARLQKA